MFSAFMAVLIVTIAVLAFTMVALLRAERQEALEAEVRVQARDLAQLMQMRDVTSFWMFDPAAASSAAVNRKIDELQEIYDAEVWLVNAGGYAVILNGGQGLTVRKDGFLACTSGIRVENAVRGMLRGLFSAPGFSLLSLTGEGVAFVCGRGAIHEVTLKEGEDLAVDNGHLAAWTDGMRFTVEKAGRRWIAGPASGEALLCRFRGPGRLLVQTRRKPGK